MEKMLQNKEAFTIDPNEKTICIIQMTRIGDLLQTIQSVRNLKKEFPQIKLKLIGRKRFARPIIELLKDVFTEVHLFNLSELIDITSLDGCLKNITNFTSKINATHNDLVINLSFSKPSGYLTSLIQADHKMGLTRDSNANQLIPDRWSQFIFSSVMTGDLNPFALVDIFNNILGVPNSYATKATVNTDSNVITLHPFSSNEKKNWNTSKWSEVVYKLLKNNETLEINVIGSESERPLSNKLCQTPILKAFLNRIHNRVGETTIAQSIDLIKSSRFFIGHDSMASHLAAIAGRTAMIISLGTVRPHETAPYSENNYVLVPKSSCFPCMPETPCQFKQCHADIPYQLVYTMAQTLFKEEVLTITNLQADNSIFHLNSVLVYRTYFNENNMLKFDNLLDVNLSTKDIMRQLFRVTWLFYLGSKEEKNPFSTLSAQNENDLIKIMNNLQHLYELSEFGKKYARYILEEVSSDTPQLQNIKDYSQKIDEIENLSKLVLKTAPLLSPLIHFFITQRGNLKGKNVVELTEETYLSFTDSSLVISVLYELTEKTVAEYRSKVKKTTSSAASEI